MNNKRLLWYGRMLILMLLLPAVFSRLHAQGVTPNYGAPAAAVNVCGNAETFNVKLFGGVGTTGTLTITLPNGFVYVPNSHTVVSGGIGINQVTANDNTATLDITNIPPGESEFSYQATASCALIGFAGTNQVTYKLDANPNVLSNPVNANNAKLNITGITNNAYVASSVGTTYTRTVTIQNGGFGAVNQLNLSSTFTGLGIGNITASAGSISVNRSLVGTDSVINVVISPDGGTFDPNEEVIITEEVTVTDCGGGTTAYDAWFGCPDKCTQSNVNGTATAGATINSSAQPSIVSSLISDPDLKCLPTGSADGWVVFQTKNTSAVPALVTLSQTYGYSICHACPGPVSPAGGVGGNTCANRTMYIDTAAGVQYSMDGGTTWTDADYTVFQWYEPWAAGGGYHDNQPIALRFPGITQLNGGDSVRIRFKIHDEIPPCCSGNWYQGFVTLGTSYTDICGNNQQTGNSVNTSSNAVHRYSMNSTSAADAVSGQPYLLTFAGFIVEQDKPVRTSADGYLDYEITLPTSLDPSTTPADNTLVKGSNTLVPNSVTFDPVTRKLRIRFLRSAFAGLVSNNDYGNWTLTASTTVNCAGTGGSASLSAFVKLADCAGSEWQAICNAPASFTVHGCPFPCLGGGPINYATKVQRTNYGIPSANNDGLPSGSIDTSLLNLESTVYGDTLAVTTTGTISGTNSFSNMYVSITKSEADAIHQFIDATAYVYNAGVLTNTLTGLTAGDVTGTTPSTRTISLTSGSNPPASFVPGDSVILVTHFRQLSTIDKRIDFATTTYTSNSAVSSDLPQFSCDGNWTGTIFNYGVTESGTQSPTVSFTECTTAASQNYFGYLINPSAPSTNRHSRFPYEIRQLFELDTLRVTVPEGFEVTNLRILVEGQGATALAGIASYPLLAFDAATNTYYYDISNLSDQLVAPGVPFSEGFGLYVTPTFKVKCKSGNFQGTQNIAGIGIHSLPYGLDWYYPGGVFYLSSSNGTFSPLNMTSASPNLTVNGNTASWEVQLSNPTTVVKPNAWIAKATGVSTTTINSVEELTGAGGTVANTATVTGGIYQLGTIPAGTSKYFRINATFSNCIADSIKLGYDYNCDAYPANITAGETGCRYQTLDLTAASQPSGVQTTIISQPPNVPQELCATLPYEIEVKNPALGTLLDTLTLRIQLPTGVNNGGVQFMPGSAQVQLPNPSYPNGSYTALSDDVQSYQQVFGGANFMYIKIPPAVLSQLGSLEAMRVKFEARTTSCDFVSGSALKFRGEGKNACGQTVSSGYQQAQSVKIVGSPDNPILFILNSSVDTVQTCAAGMVTTQYRFSMINNGPAVTDTNYRFRIALPNPWTLNTTSVNFAANTGVPPVYSGQNGGFYTFNAGEGLAVGDSVVMTASLEAPSADLACGVSDPIREEALVRFTATCIVDQVICTDMGAITSERELTDIVVDRPAYTITAFNGVAAGDPASHLTGSFTLQHDNTKYLAQNGTLKVYKDVNGDGQMDVTDSLLGTQDFAIADLANQVFTYDITSQIAGNICPVIAVLDMDCACEDPTFVLNCNNIVLPIKFANEKASVSACQVNLSWDYEASQTVVIGFRIERSNSKTASKWDKIGTTGSHETRFTDITPAAGQWLYRIKAINTDNEVVYSRILTANTTCAGTLVKVFPNPANNMINITLQGAQDNTSAYTITDNLGRVVKQGKIEGKSIITIPVDDLSGGVYHVRVVYGGNVFVQQIDIVK